MSVCGMCGHPIPEGEEFAGLTAYPMCPDRDACTGRMIAKGKRQAARDKEEGDEDEPG